MANGFPIGFGPQAQSDVDEWALGEGFGAAPLPYQTDEFMRAIYPQGIPQQPSPPQPQAVPFGRFNLPGAPFDAASIAILQQLQQARRPRNFGEGFAQGALGALAGGRARGMEQRQAEFERKQKEAEEARGERSKAAFTLRQWQLSERARKQRETEGRIPNTPELRSRALREMGVRIDPAVPWVERSDLVRDMPQGNPLLDQLRMLAIQNYGKQKPEDPKFKAFVWNMVNDNVRQDQDVKQFGIVRDQRNNAQKGLDRKNSFGDLLAMRFLARASDPETGIREEEFKTFKTAVGALAARGIYITHEMWGKGMLNDRGREFVRQSMEDIYETKKAAYLVKQANYRSVAEEFGLDPNRTVPDIVGGVDEFAEARKEKPK